MPQRRRPSRHHDPAYEDAGLFKNTIAPFDVELVPLSRRNMRQDLVVRGYVQGKPIDVIFAGRRARQTDALEKRLYAMLAHARRKLQASGTAVDPEDIRLPLQVEGAFRPKFTRDVAGWENRQYHLMVARWTLIDDTGQIDVFGALPAHV